MRVTRLGRLGRGGRAGIAFLIGTVGLLSVVLLSPSASALLRMSNVKKFLEEGQYAPADHTTEATRLHLMRSMPTIDAHRCTTPPMILRVHDVLR